MIDHVRILLLNPTNHVGYRHVVDAPSDTAMSLFGVTGSDAEKEAVVSRILPLALADDLSAFRTVYDKRVSPPAATSVYRQTADSLTPSGLYARVLGRSGWWSIAGLFQSDDPAVFATLGALRALAESRDAPNALGAVLLACAYRRFLLQGEGN